MLPSKLSMAESRTMDKPSRCLNAHRQVKRFQSSAGWGRLTWFWASRWATERKIWNQISTRVGPFIDTSETNDKELLWSTFSLSGSCKLSTHSEKALQMTVPHWNNGCDAMHVWLMTNRWMTTRHLFSFMLCCTRIGSALLENQKFDSTVFLCTKRCNRSAVNEQCIRVAGSSLVCKHASA